MLKKILIANRGEIACRIIRTARRLGVDTVAVYSDADSKAMHVQQADEAVHIGPSPATESYLRGDVIIAAAKATGAQGIHPGYGFLSENADFADAVVKAGLKFIGPSAAAMRALGGKAAAKEIAIKAGVPVVPGYQGSKQDVATLTAEARKIGYPVMIKAVAGGGGRGMRLVETEADLAEMLESAQREAQSSFGNPLVLIEKVVVRPRHIEVQVFGDAHGNVVHLFERDCTLQRRNQKVIEEAPAPGMTPALREKMCAAAVKLAKHVGYEGAGTVEFLVEGGSLGADAKWYFIEMNTRLQVEHPVTEEITGLDLVEWQLRVAAGETLPLGQDKITMSGHAIEVRLCAEDPAKGFLPSVGKIHEIWSPTTLDRLEIGVRAGDSVSPFYDSMIAKLITHASKREFALNEMSRALCDTAIVGLVTNSHFLKGLINDTDVRQGQMDTGLIGRKLDDLSRSSITDADCCSAVGHLIGLSATRLAGNEPGQQQHWKATDSFQLGPPRVAIERLMVGGVERKFRVSWPSSNPGWPMVTTLDGRVNAANARPVRTANHDGVMFAVFDGEAIAVNRPIFDSSAIDDGASGDVVRAPINGKVAKVFVVEGDVVEKGQRIAVVEAMKMEHVLHAARAGTIAKVAATEGQQVNQGALIASMVEMKT